MVDNVILSETVSVGFEGGPTFSTDAVVSVNGQERRLQNMSIARHVYSWSVEYGESDLIDELRDFWFDRRGDFKAFLMKDWADFKCINEPIGIGDGTTVTFPFSKTYTAGSNPYVRLLRHIKAGTAVVYIDGHEVEPELWDLVDGEAVFTSGNAPSEGEVITQDCEFYVPVRFEGDKFSTSIPIQREDILNVNLQAIEVIP